MENENLNTRVTVDREEEWLQVQANADQQMAEALDATLAALPGGAKGPTALRMRPKIEAELKRVRERMWELAKPNLRVNGIDYDKYFAATEPFDEKLDRSLWALNDERVNWETKVAEKRRQLPNQVADLLEGLEMRRDAAQWMPSEEDVAEEASTAKPNVRPEDIVSPPRHAEVLDAFTKVVEDLTDMAETAPQQLARTQRVQVVQEQLQRT